MIRTALILLLLCTACAAQNDIPEAPSHMRSNKSILTDWKFLLGTGILVSATVFDEIATERGLQRGRCVEGNGFNTHPSYGELAAKDWPIVVGLTGFKFFLAKVHMPAWSYESIDAVGAFKHARGGYRWVAGC